MLRATRQILGQSNKGNFERKFPLSENAIKTHHAPYDCDTPLTAHRQLPLLGRGARQGGGAWDKNKTLWRWAFAQRHGCAPVAHHPCRSVGDPEKYKWHERINAATMHGRRARTDANGRRRTRFVGSAAAYAMTSTHHVTLRPAKASYACKRGLRRVKASYGPAVNKYNAWTWTHGRPAPG